MLCEEKKVYRSVEHARQVQQRAWEKRNVYLFIYRCANCMKLHLTSKPARKVVYL